MIEEWDDRLMKSLCSGEELDLSGARSCDPADADTWGDDRAIPAAILRQLLVRQQADADPRGLQIRGARIVGDLDLGHVNVEYPIAFHDCRFDGDVVLEQATLRDVSLAGSHLRWLHCEQVAIRGDLYLNRVQLTGGIILRTARIEGRLALQWAHLTASSSTRSYRRYDATALFDTNRALDFTGAHIDSGIFALNLNCCGIVCGVGAVIGFELQLTGAEIRDPMGGWRYGSARTSL